MIRYALICDLGHDFEGWFGASGDFDEQAARGLLECPICASPAVRKQIMAPAVAGARKGTASRPQNERAGERGGGTMMMDVMHKVRRHVEANFDYVGERFAAEARSIHQGRTEQRGIYGEASPSEVRSLAEDGIAVAPLPPRAPEKTELN